MKTSLLILSTLLLTFVSYGQVGVIFDGTDFGPGLIPQSWGGSTVEIDWGTGPDGTNAIMWVEGNEYGNGNTGIQFSLTRPLDLSDAWPIAVLTLAMKCEPGTDSMRVQYVSPAGKKGMVFHPVADGQWHKYSFPLREFIYTENSLAFDPGNINTVDLMTEADAIAGKVIYITNWYVTTAPSLVLFNGVAVPLNLDMTPLGAASVDVVPGAGSNASSNALEWIQGEGKTGFRFGIAPACNLSEVWDGDSLKLKLKVKSAVDTMTVILYSGETNARGVSFVPVADGNWHQYAFPLRAMAPMPGTTSFDPAGITNAEVLTGSMAGQGVAGAAVYFDDFWTGNPFLDRVPPAAPTDACVSPAAYKNLVLWTDVPGENGERYNVYYSEQPITDITKADVVNMKIGADAQQTEHPLFAPAIDQEVTYYYAITCTDLAGNVSLPAFIDPVPNTAKGIPVISLHGPGANFRADGILSEWEGVMPFRRKPSDGSQYVVSWGAPFVNDGDLSFDAYIAVDSTYLYVAFDVIDDVVSYAASGASDQDSPDLHIGLYNWHGPAHTSFKRGSQPDYLLRFSKRRPLLDLVSRVDSLLVPGENYYWGKNSPKGYRIEARLPWTLLAEHAGDSVFVPVEGYRIPLDIMLNDADVSGTRESMLDLSPYSDGHSEGNPSVWVYTWIGDQWAPTVGVEKERNVPGEFSLEQNYPNPFNPVTTIKYNVGGNGAWGVGDGDRAGTRGSEPALSGVEGLGTRKTRLVVYDVLGRQVATLVDDEKVPGTYEVRFDASRLSSGVYYYRLTAGTFTQTRAMMVLK